MDNNELVKINQLIDSNARVLVGTIMKRFEILDNKEDIKKAIKELIYENYRNIKVVIKSFSMGVTFISKKSDKEENFSS